MKPFVVFIFTLLVFKISAQNSLKGNIGNEENEPLGGAFIYMPELNKGTSASDNGDYLLSDIPNGKYKIVFTHLGYANAIETVIFDGTEKTLDVTLYATPIETEEIVVSGGLTNTQHENAVKIDVLKLNNTTHHAIHFAKTLTDVPGVDMISKGEGVSKPVIRGLSMNDILILNNGVRYENYQYSSHHPMGIDEFGVDKVEIIKGPASLLYGSDAIGGVINFIKEKPLTADGFSGDYQSRFFSNSNGYANHLGVKGKEGSLTFGFRVGQKSSADYLQGGGDYVPNTRFNEKSLKTQLGITQRKGIFRLYYDYNTQKLGLAEEEAIDQIQKRGRSCEMFYQQLNTHLISSQNKLILGNSKMDVNVSFQNTELIHFGEPDEYELQMNLSTLSYETKLHLPSNIGSEYIIGLQGLNQFNRNTNQRETILLPNADMDSYSAYALLQHTFYNRLKILTGVRYDYKTIQTDSIGDVNQSTSFRNTLDKKYSSVSASIGANYGFSEHLIIRANLASAYRNPNLAELTSNGPHEERYEMGDIGLNPEKSYEFDLSLHYHKQNVTFDIAGFVNKINDYIYISPTGNQTSEGLPIYKYYQDNSRLIGSEAGVHIHPNSLKWLHAETSFALVKGQKNNGENLPFIPAKKINTEIRFEKEKVLFLNDLFFSTHLNLTFDQNHPSPEEEKTTRYSILDVSSGARFTIGKQPILFALEITNLMDKKYIDHLSTLKEVGFFNPGRSLNLSLKLLLEKYK